MSILVSQFFPLPFFPVVIHIFLLCVHVSISALQVRSSTSFRRVPWRRPFSTERVIRFCLEGQLTCRGGGSHGGWKKLRSEGWTGGRASVPCRLCRGLVRLLWMMWGFGAYDLSNPVLCFQGLVPCAELNGKEIRGREVLCTHMTDPLCSIAETRTIL